MRVLFLTDYFPRPHNPTMGTWALDQAEALVDGGIELKVVSFNSYVPRSVARYRRAKPFALCPKTAQWGNVEVDYPRWFYYAVNPIRTWTMSYPGPFHALAWQTARRSLGSCIETFRPDLLYVHHTLPNGYLAEKMHERSGLPFVITDHDLGEISCCDQNARRRVLYQRIKQKAFMNVAVAKRMEAEVRRIFPEVSTCTVYNGIRPIPDEILNRARPLELRNKRVVFSAAVFYRRKGIPALIKAFAKIARKYPDAVLRIAGDGHERPDVEKTITEFGLNEQVTLLGRQPRERVLQEMVWADVFALIGWDEPFATVFIEAMASGTPIVTANDGGINEVVCDGVQGYSVPPRDLDAAASAFDRLLGDSQLCQAMGSAGRSLVAKRLSSKANASEMVAIFHEAAASSNCVLQNGKPRSCYSQRV